MPGEEAIEVVTVIEETTIPTMTTQEAMRLTTIDLSKTGLQRALG